MKIGKKIEKETRGMGKIKKIIDQSIMEEYKKLKGISPTYGALADNIDTFCRTTTAPSEPLKETLKEGLAALLIDEIHGIPIR